MSTSSFQFSQIENFSKPHLFIHFTLTPLNQFLHAKFRSSKISWKWTFWAIAWWCCQPRDEFWQGCIFIYPAMFLQLFGIFCCILPLWFYKNKYGDRKTKALMRDFHELNTIKTKLKIGQPNVFKHSPDLCWWRKIAKLRNSDEKL